MKPGRCGAPREPISSVIRVVLYPALSVLVTRSWYLVSFLSAAASNDISKQTVSSMITSCFWPSSLVVEGNFSATVLAMACNTSSWCLLYLHWSKATLQLFRVWTRVCRSPQRGQESFLSLSRSLSLSLSADEKGAYSNRQYQTFRNMYHLSQRETPGFQLFDCKTN